MALMNDVYSYIENNYRPNEPIFLSELNVLGMKSVSVRQQMKKLLWLCWRYSFCKPTWSDYSGSKSI